MVELNAVVQGKCLHKLKSYPTTGEVLVRISVVFAFGIQYGNGRRQYIVGYVVVADDEVDASLFGVRYFFHGFDAAIQYDDKSYTGFGGVVHSFF